MYRFILLFSLVYCFTASAANEATTRHLLPTLVADHCHATELSTADETIDAQHLSYYNRIKAQNDEPIGISIKTTQPGELATLLGEDIQKIDVLHVEGLINDKDFETIWDATFNGHLKVVDLGNAYIENGIIPDYALFHIDDQVDWDSGMISIGYLEKLILPCNTTEIGRHAFAYATHLTEIKFPETLKKIGTSSFTDCISLSTDPFVLPKNLECIGYQAFYQCRSLAGEVVLPETLNIIDGAAFYMTEINKIDIPEGVEYLGDFAFYGCNLKEIDIPDNCHLDTRGCQLYGNYDLEYAHIPEKCKQIPEDIFLYCTNLKYVNIPDCTTHILDGAFEQCRSLDCFSSLILPEGLQALGTRAFNGVPVMDITFPASLSYIGAEIFDYYSQIKRIYCKASIPPECHDWDLRPGASPFYGVNKDIEVYVPIGSKTEYKSSFGWNHFTNFIETDNFPTSGYNNTYIDNNTPDNYTYDIRGYKVKSPIPGNIYIRHGKKFIHKYYQQL